MLRYCPKCGSLMMVDRARRVLRCPKCGYEEVPSGVMVFSRTIQHSEKEKLIVIEDKQAGVPPTAVLLKGKIRCPKCGHDEVYGWQMQTRAADEPPTTFYKCAKCGYTWREYQ